MIEDKFTLGAPVNPNSKTGDLFPGNYIVENNKFLEDFLPLLSGNGDLEIHLQEYSEIPKTEEELKKYKDLVDLTNKNNIGLMGHIHFIEPQNYDNRKPFQFNFSWPVIPSEYKDKPIAPNVNIGIKEMPKEQAYEAIDLFDKLGTKDMTMHVTKPGMFLNDEDWIRYKDYIRDLVDYIKKNDKIVEIAIETGGIEPERLEEIHKELGVNINLDSAHLYLDMLKLNPGKSDKEISDMVVNFARKTKDFTSVYHLTQTTNAGDFHWGIFDRDGSILCNDEITLMLAEDKSNGLNHHSMVESNLDERNFIYVEEVLTGVKKAKRDVNDVIIFMGLPGCGKSSALESLLKFKVAGKNNDSYQRFLEEEFFGHVIISKKFREAENNNKDSLVDYPLDEVIPKEARQEKIYKNIHKLLRRNLKGKESTTIDATYNIQEMRKELIGIIENNNPNNVYIFNAICSDEELLKRRFEERKEKAEKLKEQGLKEAADVCKFEVYEKMKEESQQFSYDEIKHIENVHVVEYDTATQKINLYNPDQRTRALANVLKKASEKKYNVKIEIINN